MTQAYSDPEQLRRAYAAFEQAFGRPPRFAAAAPGRVNLIGEHTDYNDGFVLPMALEQRTLIVAAPRDDHTIRLRSTHIAGEASFTADAALTPGEPSWANYVRGVVAGAIKHDFKSGGFDAMIDSTVPTGGGLSSSAALEVAAATLIEAITGQRFDPVAKALLCQEAEHVFAGVPCGIMDQFISVMGQADHALLIDCRSHETRPVPLSDPNLAVLIVNSNVKHELTGGEYAQRRAQCEAAAKALNVPALRDATLADLDTYRNQLDELSYRRARHVISENERTLAAADAMAKGDWRRTGELMLASHASLRDDFEVSCPELDLLVELAGERINTGEVFGSRMTGGGFGGCTVSLVSTDRVAAVGEFLRQRYHQATGLDAGVFVSRPAVGAQVVPA